MIILDEIKEIKSSSKELRSFGVLFGLILGVLGAISLWKHRMNYPYLLSGSAFFFFCAFFLKRFLLPLHKAWMTLALLLSWVMTRVILTLLFYLVLTPIGIIVRLKGNDLLNRKIEPKKDSYWVVREISSDTSRYEKQF